MRAAIPTSHRPSIRHLADLVHGTGRSAVAVGLVHVTDAQPGISRFRKGNGFEYRDLQGVVRKRSTLARIKALAIPPAWSDVWICATENGHLQATGKDAHGRKQYRYHKSWSRIRGLTKFFHMVEFGKRLPAMRRRIAADLRRKGMPREKVLTAVVALMESTRIRIGDRVYEQRNGSFGLSTLKDRHVKGKGTHLRFRGKSGILHDIPLHSRTLARLVMRCKELPGQDLFQYVDDESVVHAIDSGMVNSYLREISGGDHTSKDLRTWMGTVCFVDALLDIGPAKGPTAFRHNVNLALDAVAAHLGNTRAVCRSSYVDPRVITSYEQGVLHDHAKHIGSSRGRMGSLSLPERIVMHILEAKVDGCDTTTG